MRLIVLFFMLVSGPAWGISDDFPLKSSILKPKETPDMSRRDYYPVGAGFSIYDPYPALMGIAAAVNPADWIQVRFLYGGSRKNDVYFNRESDDFVIYSAALRLYVPGWKWTPTLGIQASHLKTDSELNANFGTASMGITWQSRIGLSVSAGISRPVIQKERLDAILGNSSKVLPYASVGYFF